MGSFTRKAAKVSCSEAKCSAGTHFYFFTNRKCSHPVPIITDLFVPCVCLLLHSYTSSKCFFLKYTCEIVNFTLNHIPQNSMLSLYFKKINKVFQTDASSLQSEVFLAPQDALEVIF